MGPKFSNKCPYKRQRKEDRVKDYVKTVAGIGALPLEANKSLESPEAGRCVIGFAPMSLWTGELPCPHLDSGLLFSKTIRG